MRSDARKASRKTRDAKNMSAYLDLWEKNAELPNLCKRCNLTKPLRLFVSNYTHRNVCRECHLSKIQKYREVNIDKTVNTKRQQFIRSSAFIASFKNDLCNICGTKYSPEALDFHHLQDKESGISRLYEKSRKRITREIAKCELICANCHREETYRNAIKSSYSKPNKRPPSINDVEEETRICKSCSKSVGVSNYTKLKSGSLHSYCKSCLYVKNQEYSKNRKTGKVSVQYIRNYKESHACQDCQKNYPYYVMDFDHLEDKSFSINKIQSHSISKIQSEIEKCEVLCANCHRVRTKNRKTVNLTQKTYVKASPNPDVLQNVQLVRIGPTVARPILEEYHYAGFGRPATELLGATYKDQTIAIIKFCPVIRKEVATSIGLLPGQMLELDRLCIVSKYQVHNLASRILSLAVRFIRQSRPLITHLVSFADTARGHSGAVYKAANWKRISASAASYYYTDSRSRRISKKAVYNQARSRGVSESDFALASQYQKVHTPGKHKFIYELCSR